MTFLRLRLVDVNVSFSGACCHPRCLKVDCRYLIAAVEVFGLNSFLDFDRSPLL